MYGPADTRAKFASADAAADAASVLVLRKHSTMTGRPQLSRIASFAASLSAKLANALMAARATGCSEPAPRTERMRTGSIPAWYGLADIARIIGYRSETRAQNALDAMAPHRAWQILLAES